jgi:hypothetical protein
VAHRGQPGREEQARPAQRGQNGQRWQDPAKALVSHRKMKSKAWGGPDTFVLLFFSVFHEALTSLWPCQPGQQEAALQAADIWGPGRPL